MVTESLARLEDTLGDLGRDTLVALDTEFMRESTYFPKLCLIQAANRHRLALLDPLAPGSLAPFYALLATRAQTKVLHAARQDLEVLALAGGTVPAGPVFDTQIAAGLLGLPPQIGYGDLVSRRLGVTLAKGHARTDWTRRPLSAEQLAYAADDVRYLGPLHDNLRDALDAAGRLSWLEEEARHLEDPALFRIDPEAAWQRLKGLERLQPAQRATAKQLAAWRERRAMEHDRPRGWILHDDTLRSIAESLPASLDDLAASRGMPPGLVRRLGTELLDLIARSRELASLEAAAEVPQRPPPEEVALAKRVGQRIRDIAGRLGLSPEILATRRDIDRLVHAGDTAPFTTGWRAEVLGDEILALVRR